MTLISSDYRSTKAHTMFVNIAQHLNGTLYEYDVTLDGSNILIRNLVWDTGQSGTTLCFQFQLLEFKEINSDCLIQE